MHHAYRAAKAWATIDDHKIMTLPPRRRYADTGMIKETLLLTAKMIGDFIL